MRNAQCRLNTARRSATQHAVNVRPTACSSCQFVDTNPSVGDDCGCWCLQDGVCTLHRDTKVRLAYIDSCRLIFVHLEPLCVSRGVLELWSISLLFVNWGAMNISSGNSQGGFIVRMGVAVSNIVRLFCCKTCFVYSRDQEEFGLILDAGNNIYRTSNTKKVFVIRVGIAVSNFFRHRCYAGMVCL